MKIFKVFNIQNLRIYKGSNYAKDWNITGLGICYIFQYKRVVNVSRFSINKGYECVKPLNIRRLHRLLNVSQYLWRIPEYS